MKSTLVALVIASILQIAHAQNQSGQFLNASKTKNLPPSESAWFDAAQSYIQKSEYDFKKMPANSFACANRAQKVVYHVLATGYSVEPVKFTSLESSGNSWRSSFQLLSVSKGAGAYTVRERC